MTFAIDHLNQIVGFPMSEEQVDAVTADLARPLLVVAGAGSGKTTVMAARVVWAVATGQVRPDEILGLTFTRKAAAELGNRVRSLLDKVYEDFPPVGVVGEPGSPLVSTYHSFAHQFVAEHGLRIGIEPGARLLTETEALQLAYRVVLNTQLPLRDLGVAPASLADIVVKLDQQLAEHIANPAQLRAHDEALIARVDALEKSVASDRTAASVAGQRIQLSMLVEEFRTAKQKQDVVDFADVMRLGHELAARDDVQRVVHERTRMVLLDEYQDTSVVQAELLAPLVGPGASVTAVGDPLQAIYSWRGAGANAMADFSAHFVSGQVERANVLPLSVSQRSGIKVLSVANDIAAPMRSESAHVVTLRPAQRADGPRRDGVRSALLETYSDEVEWLGDRIAEQIDVGTDPSEVAVLCRARSDFQAVLDALHKRGIAAVVSGAEGLLTQPEVVDILSVLQVINDPTENAAMLRILMGPRMRIGARDLAVLGRRAVEIARTSEIPRPPRPDSTDGEDGEGVNLAAAISGTDAADVVSLAEAVDDLGAYDESPYSTDARDRLGRLSAELKDLRKLATTLPLPDLVARVISSIGLDVEARLEAIARAESSGIPQQRGFAAVQALHELVNKSQQSIEDRSLAGFLAWISVIRRVDREPEFEVPAPANAVQVMTVHKAKGLEWEVVAVPFLSSEVFPSTQSRARWTQNMRHLPHSLRGDVDSLPDLVGFGTKSHDRFKSEMADESLAEERRLGYVAVTRPTRLLLASGHWWGPTQVKRRGPSELLLAVRDHCDAPTDVDPWVAEPTSDANPQTQGVVEFGWPPNLDTDQRQRRLAAASMAREAMASESRQGDESVESVVEGAWTPGVQPLTDSELAVVEEWDRDIELLLVERATRKSVDVPAMPQTMSASDFMEAQRDPRDFLSRKARPMPRPPSDAALRGTRFHTWVEQHLGQRSLFEELPGAADEELFTEAELVDLRGGFMQTPYGERVPYAVEVPFSIVVDDIVLKGRIDAIYRDGDQWEVVDWKTNASATADPTQLAVYRYAWSKMMNVPVENITGVFVYVRRAEVVRFDGLPALEVLMAAGWG